MFCTTSCVSFSLEGERGEGFVQFLTPESDEGVAIAVKPTEVRRATFVTLESVMRSFRGSLE